MKTCPKCSTQYTDDTLFFCLNDGTPLSGTITDAPTVVYHETDTVVRSVGSGEQIQETQFVSQGVPVTNQSSYSNTSQDAGGGKVLFAIAATAVVVLALVGIIAAAGYFYFRASGSTVATANTNSNATPQSNPSNRAASASPTPTASSPSPSPTSAPANVPVPPTVPQTQGGTSTQRLTMSKGSYSTAIGGELVPGHIRTYLIACRAGQQLTASVASGGPCVTISNGGSGIKWTTVAGDNKVAIRNNCDTNARYNFSVSVF